MNLTGNMGSALCPALFGSADFHAFILLDHCTCNVVAKLAAAWGYGGQCPLSLIPIPSFHVIYLSMPGVRRMD